MPILSEAVIRLLVAICCGALIGVERQWKHKNAGIKTNTLVGLGAAAFGLLSDTFAHNNNPAQMAAAVVTGIGFLGAGVIIHRGPSVQGVNTAATLWANASVGVAAGTGHTSIAVAVALGVLGIQIVSTVGAHLVHTSKDSSSAERLAVSVTCSPVALPRINDEWDHFTSSLETAGTQRRSTRTDGAIHWRGVVMVAPGPEVSRLEERLMAVDGVTSVETRHALDEDDAL